MCTTRRSRTARPVADVRSLRIGFRFTTSIIIPTYLGPSPLPPPPPPRRFSWNTFARTVSPLSASPTASGGMNSEPSRVDVSGSPVELPQDFEQHLLRIAQEAVTNAIKHAGASGISIKLHMEPGKLYLRIKDDGRGFNQEGVFASLAGHFGLIGMRERAERLGGELRLRSQPGEGTEVEVSVPLP